MGGTVARVTVAVVQCAHLALTAKEAVTESFTQTVALFTDGGSGLDPGQSNPSEKVPRAPLNSFHARLSMSHRFVARSSSGASRQGVPGFVVASAGRGCAAHRVPSHGRPRGVGGSPGSSVEAARGCAAPRVLSRGRPRSVGGRPGASMVATQGPALPRGRPGGVGDVSCSSSAAVAPGASQRLFSRGRVYTCRDAPRRAGPRGEFFFFLRIRRLTDVQSGDVSDFSESLE